MHFLYMYILFYNKTKNPATEAGLFLGAFSSEQAALFHKDEENGDDDQRENRRCQQATDDDNGHAGPRFRPGCHGQDSYRYGVSIIMSHSLISSIIL